MLPIEWKFIEPMSFLTEKRPMFINGRQLVTSGDPEECRQLRRAANRRVQCQL